MNSAIAPAPEFEMRHIDVQLLSEEDLLAITGGLSPIAAGCALAAFGGGVAVLGLCVGIALYVVLA